MINLENFPKISLNICFLELSENIFRDSKKQNKKNKTKQNKKKQK